MNSKNKTTHQTNYTLYKSEEKEYSIENESEEIQLEQHPVMAEMLQEKPKVTHPKTLLRQKLANLPEETRKKWIEEHQRKLASRKPVRAAVYAHIQENKSSRDYQEEEYIKTGICPNCKSSLLFNHETGEAYRVGCKRYDCPVCGPYRAFRLKKALKSYLKKWSVIRMMTLTYRTTLFRDALQCANLSSKIFARFTTNLRRHSKASPREKGMQYVKVAEFTKNGFLHYHILIDRYVRWEVCIEAWNQAIRTALKLEGKYIAMNKNSKHTPEQREANKKLYSGSVNFTTNKTNSKIRIDGTMNSNDAAGYVTKYVTKACREFRKKYGELYQNQAKRFKVWTKSAQIAIFTHKEKSGKWEFINLKIYDKTHGLNLVTLELSSQIDSIALARKNGIV